MLQAIITHRYDVLARYAKYLKQTAIAEISNLHARNPTGLQEATALEAVKHWLQRDAGELPEKERAALQQALHSSEVLKDHLLDAAGTDRSVEPLYCIQRTEQLVKQLENWCQHAEESGIRALQEFSRKLRCYD